MNAHIIFFKYYWMLTQKVFWWNFVDALVQKKKKIFVFILTAQALPFFASLQMNPALYVLNPVSFYQKSPFQFDRYSSARYSSRRARTLESLASLYEVRSVTLISFPILGV